MPFARLGHGATSRSAWEADGVSNTYPPSNAWGTAERFIEGIPYFLLESRYARLEVVIRQVFGLHITRNRRLPIR